MKTSTPFLMPVYMPARLLYNAAMSSVNTENSYSRRRFLGQASAFAAGSLLWGCMSRRALPGGQTLRPNVLFIAVDDLRTQLGCYGHEQTLSPNIDRLAAQGVVFGRAYCQVPVCGASRASLLTGIRPDFAARRFTNANSRADADVPGAVTLPRHFRDHGFHTISNGKIFHFVQDSPQSWSEPPWRVYDYDTDGAGDWGAHNFDKIWLAPGSRNHRSAQGRGPFCEAADVPDDAYEDGKVADKTINDLRRLKRQDAPFFLACGFSRPHLPFNAPKRYYDLYDPGRIELATNRFAIADKPRQCTNSSEIRAYSGIEGWPEEPAFHGRALHGYYACVSYIDALVGRILNELKTLRLDQNTIVVLWGDHGWHLGEHNFWGKHNTLNNALQVPLIVRAPGLGQGGVANGLVEFVDLYPTLCELAHLPVPPSHTLAGQSFAALLTNPSQGWKEAVFSEWQSGRAVKTDRFLYTEWKDGGRMLFDHKADPGENRNIADDLRYQQVIARHSELLNHSNPDDRPTG
ncbi:MAG: sulfatase [Planctomycetaceae bacterium]|nr:sulfatase [Planctomycetaceae bacterium]